MKMNSDTASKLIKNLQSEIDMLLRAEKRDCTYSHSPSETPIVPEYSFADTQKRLEELRGNMAALRHAVNRFNIETKVPGFDITVDEALGHMSRLYLCMQPVELSFSRKRLLVEKITPDPFFVPP